MVRVVVCEREYRETNQCDTGDYSTQKGADEPGGSSLFLLCRVSDAKDIDKDPGYELKRIHGRSLLVRLSERWRWGTLASIRD